MLVGLVHLLQEDEGEDGVGAQAGIVRSKALPQAEEALVADDLHQYILNRQVGKALGLGPGLWGPGPHPQLPLLPFQGIQSSSPNPQPCFLTSPFLYSGFPSIIRMFWILKEKR